MLQNKVIIIAEFAPQLTPLVCRFDDYYLRAENINAEQKTMKLIILCSLTNIELYNSHTTSEWIIVPSVRFHTIKMISLVDHIQNICVCLKLMFIYSYNSYKAHYLQTNML